MKYCALFVAAGLVAALLGGCGSGGGSGSGSRTQITPSGLKIEDIRVGIGPMPQNDDTVVVEYTGWLTNGTQFDTSVDRGPFEFVLGAGRVIKGWDEGLLTMKVGGKRRLTIPPDLAYGETGSQSGSIPPNATLVFEVELLQIKPLEWIMTDSGLSYADITVGEGISPTPGSGVAIDYTLWLADGTRLFSTRDEGNEAYRFSYGLVPPRAVPGLEEGLSTMKVGGTRKLIIPPHLAFGLDGYPPNIPPNATLKYDVELVDVQTGGGGQL